MKPTGRKQLNPIIYNNCWISEEKGMKQTALLYKERLTLNHHHKTTVWSQQQIQPNIHNPKAMQDNKAAS